MSTRRRAREIVLQLLYEADINGTRDAESCRRFIRSRMQGRKALTSFACKLLDGTLEHRDQIDQRLARLATNWTLPRMPVVDRNVLRLGGYEILFSDTPGRVAVNESILLAKRYGDKNSPRFINGILDRLMKDGLELPSDQNRDRISDESGGETSAESAESAASEASSSDVDSDHSS
ncbi:hypothetical protein Poly59_49330 [Rubripirellula reticaptiva]|uniref:Transcription antitermination protein NusB n=1 Tax=Rubripirellula reticaptiva TaxID=2528013 RepID=A0A5C6EGZ9_9BACT|nr:hypothetical protein Poly59_49330 [Rubripirellula reticaptiva]